jgi:cell division septation protein DedD
MIREFDEEELRHDEHGRDTELTLSSRMLLALGGGLLLLCAVCFGLGYAIGHRSEPALGGVLPATAAQNSLQPSGASTKPTAGEKTPAPPPPVIVPVDAGVTQTSAGQQGTPLQQDLVKPALAAQSALGDAAQAAPALHVQPALAQVQGWMVQIAAVSRAEDAEVLVNALKKRGYSVAVRRDVADNLLHVQTGPFVTHNEANAMRQKLLNDGYNAIVQP